MCRTTENTGAPLAPIKFHPVYKTKIWGGEKILPFKGLPASQERIGESWEISGVRGSETTVCGGPYDGMDVTGLVRRFGARLVGNKVHARFGDEFPILVKFIDAADDLSIQVHPGDEMARRLGYPNGKSEMWYVVSTNHRAHIVSGFNRRITPAEYKRAVAEGTLQEALQDHEAHTGDCFFIPAGRVHSIGCGTFLAEIQQTSDVTYRIYDYNRRDSNGCLRELHTELAAQAIDFSVQESYRTRYTPLKDTPVTLADCNVFKTRLYDLTSAIDADYSSTDSFVIYMMLAGKGHIVDAWGNETPMRQGESLLVPAENTHIHIVPDDGGMKFLETYL